VIERLRQIDPRRVDALVAAALLALGQLESWLSDEIAAGQRLQTAAAATVMTVALAWRRRRPLESLLVVMAAFSALALADELPALVFLLPVGLLSMYSVAAHASAERAVVGLAIGLATVAASAVRTDEPTLTDLTAPALMFAGAWAVGRSQLTRRRRSAQLERAAVAEERRRLARELHDIVAHRVSTIVIQAESGRATVEEPARADAAFEAIAGSGRQALEELRRLLGLLRDPGEGAVMTPQPGLARVDELVEEARGAGLEVDVRMEGDLRRLPPGVDLAAYRLLQESLTNVLRHARTPATVRVAREPGAVALEVRNALAGESPYRDGAGQGLAGMRERVRVFDGSFSAAPEDGEFVVRATLPLDAAER
jgi:signal transduction histidine kinase